MITVKEAFNKCDKIKLREALNKEFSNENNPDKFAMYAIKNIDDNRIILIDNYDKILIAIDHIYYDNGILSKKLKTFIVDRNDLLISEKANINDVSFEYLLETRDFDILGATVINNHHIYADEYDNYFPNQMFSILIPNCMIEKFGLENLAANVLYKTVSFIFDSMYSCECNENGEFHPTNKIEFVTVYKTPKPEDKIDDEFVDDLLHLKDVISTIVECDKIIDEIKSC